MIFTDSWLRSTRSVCFPNLEVEEECECIDSREFGTAKRKGEPSVSGCGHGFRHELGWLKIAKPACFALSALERCSRGSNRAANRASR